MEAQFNKVFADKPWDNAQQFAELVKAAAAPSVVEFLPKIKAALEDKKDDKKKSGGAMIVGALHKVVGSAVEPFTIPLLTVLLDLAADKKGPVAKAAKQQVGNVAAALSPASMVQVMPIILEGAGRTKPWQTKVAAFEMIETLVGSCGKELSYTLDQIIPACVDSMWDTKKDVGVQALKTLDAACTTIGNADIEPFIPIVISALKNPGEVGETIYKLAGTTFVQVVEAPALATMVPVLIRGFREKTTAIQRLCSVISDNMVKLVDDPISTEPFLAQLAPENAKLQDVSDPECRKVGARTQETLDRLREEGLKAKAADSEATLNKLTDLWKAHSKVAIDANLSTALSYVGKNCVNLMNFKQFSTDLWNAAVVDFLAPIDAAAAAKIAPEFMASCMKDVAPVEEEEGEEEEGETLCDCEFSLAYGNKILLNQTKLKLKRGQRYGLVGPNDCGKSTLMRSIAQGQVEGFPGQDVLTSVYLESDIPAELADYLLKDFVRLDEHLKHLSMEDDIIPMLKSVDFSDQMLNGPVYHLSGGWRMKLALSRAILRKADILLLDEPTNHLDVRNVQWVQNYLMNLPNVTVIAVSHSANFLDTVCQNIIHLNRLKLKKYKGNLTKFIEVYPEAKGYYELKSDRLKFHFPSPGFLEGVKSKNKALLKMRSVGFTYPNTTRKILTGVSIFISLVSRVAVVGPNGAGKSTMIKLISGELVPDEGTVEKHPNMRLAYVAQHAFHHIEHHMEKTPNQYVQWRFSGNEDREAIVKATLELTPEEEAKVKLPIAYDGKKRVIERLVSRKQLKKTFEYEVKWEGADYTQNVFLAKDFLMQLGFDKLMQRVDEREAQSAGAFNRPLTQQMIEKHYTDVGLEVEFVSHNQIRALSGGQKVKVVLGAAVWMNPHVIILDEPTNYLDRESLGALADAIREFGGGILLVSHHLDFTTALCQEKWVVDNGGLSAIGSPEEYFKGEAYMQEEQDEIVDGAGNTIKVEKAKKTTLTRKEKMQLKKQKAAAKARGEDVSDSDED